MRIVIADDAALFREGVAHLLTENGLEVVDQVGDADALLACVRDRAPTWLSSTSACRRPTPTKGFARPRDPRALSRDGGPRPLAAPRARVRAAARRGEARRRRIPDEGARRPCQQLLDAVERVAAGECVVDRAVVDELLARRRRVDPIAELTPREREILALMAEGRSNQGICRTLWLSPKTVETHIRGAFAKLGIKEAPEDNRRVLAVLAYLQR